MQNTTLTCQSFTHFADLFNPSNPNVTHLITTCPQHCALAWGVGNPDLSGIGVFLSYSLQFALCIIFGPGHILLHHLTNDKLRQYLSSIHAMALTTTILVACPIAIASIVYLKHQPALFEVMFLYYLNVMEFLCGVILFCTYWIEKNIKSEEGTHKSINARDATTIFLGGMLHCGLFAGVVSWIGQASVGKESVAEFISACEDVGTPVPIPPVQIFPETHALHEKKALSAFVFILVAGACVLGFCYFGTIVEYLWRRFSAFLPLSVKHFIERCIERFATLVTFNALYTLVVTGLAAGMAYCFARMHLARQQLAGVARDEYTDNEWQFGQVVALFVWVPLLVEFLFPLLCVALDSVEDVFERVKRRKERKGNKDTEGV